MNDPEVYCSECDWEGLTKELEGLACPNCKDTKNIWDTEPLNEYDNMVLGGGKFNWNKK